MQLAVLMYDGCVDVMYDDYKNCSMFDKYMTKYTEGRYIYLFNKRQKAISGETYDRTAMQNK